MCLVVQQQRQYMINCTLFFMNSGILYVICELVAAHIVELKIVHIIVVHTKDRNILDIAI